MVRREHRPPRQGEVASYLSRKAEWAKAYGEEIRFRKSPCCGDDDQANPSIQINSKSGLWRCFRCQKTGNFFTLARLYGDQISDQYKEPEYQKPDIEIIRKFIAEKRRPASGGHYPQLVEYCRDRGITEKTLDAWRVSSKGCSAIRWPIYDVIDGYWTIVNMKVRSIDPESKLRDWFDVKGGPTDLMIGNHLIDINGPKRAIIFEGQWDAMTAWEMGLRNVFSLPSGASAGNLAGLLRFIPQDWEIWLCSDMDEAGDKCAEKFFASLDASKLRRFRLPFKDLNEWYREDPFITESDLLKTLSGSDHFFLEDNESTSESLNFMEIDMTERVVEENRIIASTPWEGLNEKIQGGFYKGQTTSVLGHSGGGKTAWVNQIAIHAASEETIVGLMSVEGSRESLKMKIMDSVRGGVDPSKYPLIKSRLLVSPLFGTQISEAAILNETARMIRSGAELIVIDNLDFITGNDFDMKGRLHKKLVQIALEKGIHIIFVWQPHKVDRNRWLTSGDQKGLSSCLQDSENYFVLNRNAVGMCATVEKTREHGIDLSDDKVWFDWNRDLRIHESRKTDIEQQNRFTKTIYEGKLINLFETIDKTQKEALKDVV